MYLQKVISWKTFFKLVFFGVLKVTDENSRIRGSGSTPKCHGSGTLRLRSQLLLDLCLFGILEAVMGQNWIGCFFFANRGIEIMFLNVFLFDLIPVIHSEL
jgi:hypothetical protein